MATTRIQQTFDCDEDTYWNRIFLDDDFNTRLYTEHLGFPEWKVESQEETDGAIDRTVRITPKTAELPKPVKKLVGDNIGYREKGRFDKDEKRYTFHIVPNTMADKLTIEGEMWIEAKGDKIQRVLDLEVKAKVFGIGKIVEKRIIDDTRKGYENAYPHIQAHLRSL